MVQQIIVSRLECVTDMPFKKMKMRRPINSTIFSFYLACDLYAEIDFGVHMIRNQCLKWKKEVPVFNHTK